LARPPLGRRVARAVDTVDALMVALVITWGLAFAAIKELGHALDPYQMTWFRYLPFLVLYGLWLPFARRKRFGQVAGGDWPRFALAGALGVIGYHFPLNWGLDATEGGAAVSAGTGAILVATTPLWTLLFAVAMRQERFDAGRALGSAVAFVGVVVVVFLAPVGGAQLTVARKALVVLLAPVCWGMYSIVAKPLVDRYGGLFVTGLTFCLGTLMLLPLGIQYGAAPLRSLTPELWAWLAFVSLLSTVAGYTVWNHALRHRRATEVTIYIYLVPVVATLAGWAVVGEAVSLWFLVGAALVLAGVVQVNRSRRRGQALHAAPAAAEAE